MQEQGTTGGKRKKGLRRSARTARPRDLLANAHASEINWSHAAPLLKGRRRGQFPFVYFVGEEEKGPVKIGTAADPIARLRGLQTGNPRRLRIERLIYGDRVVEKLLHGYLSAFVVGGKRQATTFKATHAKDTEWFIAEARPNLIYVADAVLVGQRQVPHVDGEVMLEDFTQSVHETMQDLGYELHESEPLRLLARGPGYVEIKT